MARRGASEDPKVAALREARCLNPHPEDVTDEAFRSQEFFDARDAVQVKYEMVRRVRVDGDSVTATAAAFGYSRPSYYEAAATLEEQGLDGLVPGKPGPRRGHKLTDEVCAFADQQLSTDPSLRPAESGGADRGPLRRARAPPLDRASAGPLPGTAVQKPLTHPPTSPEGRTPRPCPRDPRLAPRLLNRAPARMPARITTLFPVVGWTPATNSCVTPPCTRVPRRSRWASPCSPARA